MRRSLPVTLVAMLLSLLFTQPARAAQLVTTYAVGQQPFGVVSDATSGRLYVANSGTRLPSGGGLVSVVDPTTATVTTLTTTNTSNLLAIDSAARRLYSSNADLSGSALSLDVFDLDSGALVRTLSGIGGLGVGLDETRSRLYAASGRFLVSLDTTTYDMNVVSAPFGQTWFGVAVDRGLGRVFVSNISSVSPSLVVLDANTLQTVGNISMPSSPRFALAVDEATHRVFVGGNVATGDAWTVSIVDGMTFALTTTSFGRFPSGIVHDPSAHRLWVTGVGGLNSPQSALTALDDQTLAVQSEMTLPWQPALATFARDGLLYVSGQSAGVLGAVSVNEPANAPPVIDRVTVSPGLPATNDTLTATVEAHDPDGDIITVTYQWMVNGAVLSGETSPTLDLSEPGHGDRNDSVCLTVTVSDGHPTLATSLACFGVRDSAPVATVSLDSATPATDAVLHATASATDADGDVIYFAFTWTLNGVTVRTSSGSSATDELDLAQPGRGNKGDHVIVTVVAFDGFLYSAEASASAVVANSTPTVAVVLNNTHPWRHDVILATATGSDRDGDVLNYRFTWRVNGVVMQTTDCCEWSTFDLDAFNVDNHATITVDVVATDGTASASASATATVTPPGH